MHIAFVVGRTPLLAKKEIEAAATILPFQWSSHILPVPVVILKSVEPGGHDNNLWEPKNPHTVESLRALHSRLGGTIKVVWLYGQVDSSQRGQWLTEYIERLAAGQSGKLTVGVSLYGKGRLNLGAIKRSARLPEGVSLRLVSDSVGAALSSAQVLHNHLLGKEKNREVVLIQEGERYWVGETVSVQDIDQYAKRDFTIPEADPLSGMLPPKVAQIMINLAVSGDYKESCVYDPFCGNGRIVGEALLMGLPAYGSDRDLQKVESTQRNLEWLIQQFNPAGFDYAVWQQDATVDPYGEINRHAPLPLHHLRIVSEPWLGPPLRQPLRPAEVEGWKVPLLKLYDAFFTAWSQVPQQPASFVIIFPKVTVQTSGKLTQLSLYRLLVDRLEELGYSSLQVSDYGRPDAVIIREIVQVSYRSKG